MLATPVGDEIRSGEGGAYGYTFILRRAELTGALAFFWPWVALVQPE